MASGTSPTSNTSSVSNYQNTAVICKKHNILLTKNKDTNVFSIRFETTNSNIDVDKTINFTIFKLMNDLNEDLFDKIEVSKNPNDEEGEVLFYLSQFGKELGISKKYMYVKTRINRENNRISFYSNSIPYQGDNLDPKYSMITNEFSDMYVDILGPKHIIINYVFKIDLHENLPIYMENIIGLLMKKMIYRLKVYIENVK
jgi:hypothetical protein